MKQPADVKPMSHGRPAAAGELFVVGLGNPERRYAKTRHNVGFMVLKELRGRWDFGRARTKFHGRIRSGRIGERAVRLLAPQTYMNRSGLAVAEMSAFYKAAPQSVLIVMDDMALALGRIRVRARGSAGGHNGLGDIIQAMGTDEVPRLRIGIGRGEDVPDAKDYVLSEFQEHEKPAVTEVICRAADAVEGWVTRGITYVMDHYNTAVRASDGGEAEELAAEPGPAAGEDTPAGGNDCQGGGSASTCPRLKEGGKR